MTVRLMPLVYVSDMDASVAFYEALGFPVRYKSRPGVWAELDAGGAILALHWAPSLPPADSSLRVELSMESQQPLEELLEDLRAKGVKTDAPIMDEDFGRSVVLQDPDGLRIQVNEHDRALHT